MEGWISLHRSLLNHWMAEEPEAMALWIRMLLEANHSSVQKMFNGTLINIERGQLIFGLEACNKKTGIKIHKLRKFLNLFEKDSMIRRQRFNKYSLISITNYDSHQSDTGKAQAKRRQSAGKAQHYNNVNNENKNTMSLLAEDDAAEQDKKKDEIPYQEIINLYNQHLPDLRTCNGPSTRYNQNIKRIWKAKKEHRDLGFWNDFFRDINQLTSRMDWWSGKTSGRTKDGLDFITGAKGFDRTIEDLMTAEIWE